MTISVNTQSKHEEEVLLAFLDSLRYDYHTEEEFQLSAAQQEEVLKRDKDFEEGRTTARHWREIKEKMDHVYR